MKRRGRGIACMWYPIGFTVSANPSAAVVKVNEDGTATVLTGTVETGQGSLAVLGQIAAEALGIAAEDVFVVSADTDTTPMDTGAIASRTTYVTGNAIKLAAENARAILFEVAAQVLGVMPAQLEARDRKIEVKGFPQHSVAIGEIAKRAQVTLGQPPIGSASWNPPTVAMDPETGQGKPFSTYVYATQIAEVDVDDETGEVDVLRIAAAHDCGTPINPALAMGQIYGGVMKAIGHSLYEEMIYDDAGRCVNPRFLDYKIPSIREVPEDFRAVLMPVADEIGPFGGKSVSEISLNGAAPAIAIAIHDAVGAWVREWPFTPERVLRAMGKL
jgi:CO/xanthine dehydrogenase Mo-binding subunit